MSRGAWFYRQASLTFTCDCLPGPPPSIPCTRGLPRAALVLGLRGGWGRPTLGKALTATLTSAPDSGCSRSQKQRKPFPQQAGHVTKSHLLPSGSLWRIFKTPVFGYKQSDACCVSHTHSQACGHTHEPAPLVPTCSTCRPALSGHPLETTYVVIMGFPGGSDGKESACNVGDPGLTPG